MNLLEIRTKIDEIDDELVRIFTERMKTVAEVALYKKSQNLPVYDAAREEKKLETVRTMAGDEMADYTEKLYRQIFSLSREYEEKLINGDKK